MNITKCVYNHALFLALCGMTLCNPASLIAMASTEASHEQNSQIELISDAQLPLLFDKAMNGTATPAELRSLIHTIIIQMDPLVEAALTIGDTELHTHLTGAIAQAKTVLADANTSTPDLKHTLDRLMDILAPLLAELHGQSMADLPGMPASQGPTSDAVPAIPQTEEERALDIALNQLNSVDLLLQELALVVESNTVKMTNKKKQLETIKELRTIIGKAQNSAYTNVDAANIAGLASITKAIIDNIDAALKDNFKEFPPLELDHLITRSPQAHISLQDAQELLDENNDALESVSVEAKKAGLLWYNKLYRIFDNYIVQPGQKYKILHTDFPWLGSRTKMAGFGAMAAAILLYISHSEQDKDNDWVTDRFGHAPHHTDSSRTNLDTDYHYPSKAKIAEYNKAAQGDPNANPPIEPLSKTHLQERFGKYPIKERSLWGREDLWLRFPVAKFDQIFQSHNPLLFGIFPLFYYLAKKELQTGQEWINKKCHALANFLKGGAYLNSKPSSIDKIIPKFTLNDLVGLDHVKAQFADILNYFDNPEKCARSKTIPSLFRLLTGPTRTGKTHSAEALAGSIRKMLKDSGRNEDDFNFFVLQSSSVALTSSINELLKIAEEFAPCIIFIDEIDLLQLQRAGGDSKRLSEFLTAMSGALDGRDLSKPVVLMAATNHPENMDKALLQPGRFKEIRFEYPCYKDRLQFLYKVLQPLIPNLEDIDVEKLARETEGGSYQSLQDMIRGGFTRARMESKRLAQYHLEYALDTEIRQIIMEESYILSKEEKFLIATHQAGHALATLLLNGNTQLAKVTTRPYLNELTEEGSWKRLEVTGKHTAQAKMGYGKTYTYHQEETRNFMSSAEMIKSCKIHLAGHIAEKVIFGDCSYSYHKEEDRDAVNRLLEPVVTKGGKIDTKNPSEQDKQYIQQITALSATYENEVLQLLQYHKAALIALAHALAHKQSLSRDEVIDIVIAAEQMQAKQRATNAAQNAVPATAAAA